MSRPVVAKCAYQSRTMAAPALKGDFLRVAVQSHQAGGYTSKSLTEMRESLEVGLPLSSWPRRPLHNNVVGCHPSYAPQVK